MARLDDASIIHTTPRDHLQPGVSIATLPRTDGGVISVTDLSAGMIQNLPRDQTPAGSGRVIENGRVRDDWVGMREGTSEIGTKPDSNRVIGLFSVVRESGDKLVCRVTQSTFHTWDGSSWNAFSVSGGFKGTAKRVTASELFGKLYLAFDISDGLWEVDFDAATVTQVSGAPSGRFTITFAERVLLAHVTLSTGGYFPSAYSWSVNSDPQDWDGEGSGFTDLISDSLGNEITGLVALENHAVVMRRKSIVLVSRQPFALAPFRNDTVFRGLGSDLPFTTVAIPGGIIFADSATQDVYMYRPGGVPQSMTHGASHIHGLLFADLAQARHSLAAYDPYEGEYHLGLVWTTDDQIITRRWVCNIHRGNPAWSYDDGPSLTCFSAVLPSPAATTIDGLTGTIDALTGAIDELSSLAVPSPRIYGGVSTGEVIEFSHDHEGDWDASDIQFTFQSPNIGNPSERRTLKDLELNCEIPVTGSVTIEQSKDESTWTNTKTESRTGATGRQKVRLPRTQLTGNDLYWRVVTTAPAFRLYSWFARVMDKGQQYGIIQ